MFSSRIFYHRSVPPCNLMSHNFLLSAFSPCTLFLSLDLSLFVTIVFTRKKRRLFLFGDDGSHCWNFVQNSTTWS